MFQIYGLQGEPEPEHKVGSPHTTILDLSTIVHEWNHIISIVKLRSGWLLVRLGLKIMSWDIV